MCGDSVEGGSASRVRVIVPTAACPFQAWKSLRSACPTGTIPLSPGNVSRPAPDWNLWLIRASFTRPLRSCYLDRLTCLGGQLVGAPGGCAMRNAQGQLRQKAGDRRPGHGKSLDRARRLTSLGCGESNDVALQSSQCSQSYLVPTYLPTQAVNAIAVAVAIVSYVESASH